MPSVTKEQRQYAVKRIQEEAAKRIAEYKEKKCLTRPSCKLTDEEKKALVFAGKVPVATNLSMYNIRNDFDFSGYEHDAEYDDVRLETFTRKMNREIAKAADRIMLGDAADIMQVIADFEKDANAQEV